MQEKYHISRAFTTVVVAHQECVKSQVFNERGSKNTRTM